MSKFTGCPGASIQDLREKDQESQQESGRRQSQLRQWPIQLHLIMPTAPYYENADILLTADCVAYALGDFHKDYLKGKAIAIGCPKLDEGQEVYIEKVASWVDDAKINTLTVIIMEVPCCKGLVNLAMQGTSKSNRKVSVKAIVVGIQGDVLSEEWLS